MATVFEGHKKREIKEHIDSLTDQYVVVHDGESISTKIEEALHVGAGEKKLFVIKKTGDGKIEEFFPVKPDY